MSSPTGSACSRRTTTPTNVVDGGGAGKVSDDDSSYRQSSIDDSCSYASFKQRALHEEDLPQTVSIGSSNSSYSTTNYYGGDIDASSTLCPITGRLSNVLDDYVVFPKTLGEGHYGIVRECIHRSTGQELAIKSVEKSKISRLDHLKREIDLLSNVEHNNIMKMIDCYEDVDYVHIISEKYTGGELFDKIIDNTSDSGCYSEQKTSGIIKSLLLAVAYLHDKGIVHRDIKPENLLFETDQEDVIKLIDFGLSRRHEEGEMPMSNPVGTAYYMSPELLKGKYDRSCDLWSIGTITYILLCGFPPYNGDDDPEIFEAIKNDQFDFPGQAWVDKSDVVKDFIKGLLRKDPQKRFTTEEALAHPWIVELGRGR